MADYNKLGPRLEYTYPGWYTKVSTVLVGKLLMFTGLNYAVIDLNTKEIVYTGTVDTPAVGSKTGGVAQVTILPLDNSLLLTFVDSSALVRYSLSGNTLVKMHEVSSQTFGGNTSSTAHIYGASSNVIFIRNSALGEMGYFQYNFSSIDTNSKITHFGSYNKSLGVGHEQVWAENDTVLYGAPSYKFAGANGNTVSGLAVLGVDKVIAISSAKVSLFTKGASSFTVATLSNRPNFSSIQTGVETTANGFLLQSYEESALCSVVGTNIVQHKMFAERLEFVGETETHVVFRKNNGGTYTQFIIYESNRPPTSSTIPNQSTYVMIPKTLNIAPYFTDVDGDALTYSASSSTTSVATVSVSGSTLTLQPVAIGSTIITVTANDGKGGTKSTTFTFSVVNSAPTVTLSSPTNNLTLYENDSFNIAGTAIDTDPNQSVTVYYQIDDNPKKVLAANLSQIQIALSKVLTFKGGKMFDGITVVTGALADGVAHTLKVWAEDGEKASSSIIERTFYVVSNRAPLLTVDPITPNGIIDTDKFKIKGSAGDPDANASVKVSYRINNGNPVQIYNGPGGEWEFEVSLGQLKVGENIIVVEVIDNYGAKTSKTIKLNKNTVKTPILQSVARYKIEPPKGSAKGVLLFIERDADLAVKVELSMTLTGEQEQYITLTPVNTAPTNSGTIEDTFEHTVSEEKQNIILKITPSRTDLSFNHKIHLISGAVD